MESRRKCVVVEGMSVISSLSSIGQLNKIQKSPYSYFDNYPVFRLSNEAETKLLELEGENKSFKRLDRVVKMAMLTAKEAYQKAGWIKEKRSNTLISIGSSRGATQSWEKYHAEFCDDEKGKTFLLTSPLTTLGIVSSEVASYLSIEGMALSHSSTCSSAVQAICNAFAWLQSGMAEKALVGGSEAAISPFTLAQIEALGIYSRKKDHNFPCQPLNTGNENTFVLGEGAGILALSLKDISECKDDDIIIDSYGLSFTKPPSLTGIDREGTPFINSMRMAIDNSATKRIVDVVVMHAPGTVKGDMAEWNAMKKVFGSNVPAGISTKCYTGHTYAASAILSLQFAVEMIHSSTLPELPYNSVLHAKCDKPEKILLNATGFGGNTASLIICRAGLLKENL